MMKDSVMVIDEVSPDGKSVKGRFLSAKQWNQGKKESAEKFFEELGIQHLG